MEGQFGMKDIKLFSEMWAVFLLKKFRRSSVFWQSFRRDIDMFDLFFNLFSVNEGEGIHRAGAGAKAAANAEFRVEDQFVVAFQSVHSASFHAEPAADTGIGVMAGNMVGEWPGSNQV